MDEQRTRIQEDLRGLLDGEVRCDDIFLQLYASDASLYQIRPLGVVAPRTTADVSAVARYAFENEIPLHARGAGSGLAGESLGPGLVIDFSRHMRRIIETGPDYVRVQPGLVHDRLNQHLRSIGRRFAPDPAMSLVTTLGSVVALDAAGSHWIKYGSARSYVRALEIVLADGEVLEVGREPLSPRGSLADGEPTRREQLLAELGALLESRQTQIQAKQAFSIPNRAGYVLAGVLEQDHLHLPKLLCGSEGTLALFTELTLDTVPLPPHRGLALLLFDRLDSAVRAVPSLIASGVSTCDLMDRRHLSLARDVEPRYDLLIPREAEAVLLVEQEGADVVDVRQRLRDSVHQADSQRHRPFGYRFAVDPQEVELFAQLARKVTPTLHRMKGAERPLPFVEDLAVPPENLPEFLLQVQNTLKRFQVTASLFGHAGHGQLHLRPFLNLDDPTQSQLLQPLASELYEAVIAAGGTISGEHGDGLSRTQFLRMQYGELYSAFAEVKHIFDPRNILNPGKIVGDDASLMTRNLRPVPPAAAEPRAGEPEQALVELQLQWRPGEMLDVARSCNGCGACRTTSAESRMCPTFRYAPTEEASPRAKANLMRAVLEGELELESLAREEMKEVADLCVNCQMCRLECPVGVDIPRLMNEGKAQYVAVNGLRPSDWVWAHVDRVASVASRFSWFANLVLGNRRVRWVVEKLLGIAGTRKLPRFTANSLLHRARRRRLTRPTRRLGSKVLYFCDTYANYCDPSLGEALISILEHNGIAVYIHPQMLGSGMSMLTLGAAGEAREVARHNVALLAEAVRQGYQIVATEPSAVLALTREYPHLLGDDESRLVAERVSDACQFVWRLHREGRLKLDLRPINASIGYHLPCHLQALGVGSPGEHLLRLIPALRVERLERGCSGMAGTFGLKQENLRSSLRAGWGLISAMRHPSVQAGATECCACKMQMEQGANKPVVHPLKLLAHSYGFSPDVARQLTAPTEELFVT